MKGSIDSARFADVQGFLTIQEKEARLVAGRGASVLPDVLAAADSVRISSSRRIRWSSIGRFAVRRSRKPRCEAVY